MNITILSAPSDSGWAEWIQEVLEQNEGYDVRLSEPANWIVDVNKAERALILLSPDMLDAIREREDWTAFFSADPTGYHGRIVPMKVAPCHPYGLFRAITPIDLVGVREAEATERLLAGVMSGRRKPQTPPSFPG